MKKENDNYQIVSCIFVCLFLAAILWSMAAELYMASQVGHIGGYSEQYDAEPENQ